MLADLMRRGGRVQIALTLSANTTDYDVYANRGATYVAGISDITVTVNSGVVVGASTTSVPALTVSNSFNANDTVTIVNNGYIAGRGGNGGNGGAINQVAGAQTPQDGTTGQSGGPALTVQRATNIINNGTIGGGGGGGGGGASCGRAIAPYDCAGGQAGGGGAGGTVSLYGAVGVATDNGHGGTVLSGDIGNNSTIGPPPAAGAGLSGKVAGSVTGGASGSGGGLGATGSAGGIGSGGATANAGAGGAAGVCTTTGSNANINWMTAGTRLGALN